MVTSQRHLASALNILSAHTKIYWKCSNARIHLIKKQLALKG